MVKPARLYFLIIFFFFGCAEIGLNNKNGSSLPPSQPASAYPFTDIPIPPDFSRNDSKSWIYESGSGNVRVVRLFFSGYKNQDQVLTFYQNEMINNGWKLVNSIKTEVNQVLHYDKEGWVSTIILNSNIVSTFIEIQAGPK